MSSQKAKNCDISSFLHVVFESKKFITEACWKIVHNAMQVVDGIGNVAKAQGMSEIVRKANLSRQNLYKARSPFLAEVPGWAWRPPGFWRQTELAAGVKEII
jgi:DNA-binding phage protein